MAISTGKLVIPRARKGVPHPDQIFLLREAAGQTQAQFAKKALVDTRTMRKWEGGEAGMPGAVFELLKLKTLSRDECEFIDGNGLTLVRLGFDELLSLVDKTPGDFTRGLVFGAIESRRERDDAGYQALLDLGAESSAWRAFDAMRGKLIDRFIASTSSRLDEDNDDSGGWSSTWVQDLTSSDPFVRGFALQTLMYRGLDEVVVSPDRWALGPNLGWTSGDNHEEI